MKKKVCILIFVFLLFLHYDGYGQIPEIFILPPGDATEVSSHVFSGLFQVDSIVEYKGKAYLITVAVKDSVVTNSELLRPLTSPGVLFTVISLKCEESMCEDEIHPGGVYYFTLSPPDGVWTLFDTLQNDWGYNQFIRDPDGVAIRVPFPLINTQLMIAMELNGLQYYNNKLKTNLPSND